jgi:hypothetical protein
VQDPSGTPRRNGLPRPCRQLKTARMRDAVVYSGQTWETYNVPERIALALAQLGCRILYCEAPVSLLRAAPRPQRRLEDAIISFQPAFLGSRVTGLPLARNLQAKAVSRQIERASTQLGLRDPIFIYVHMNDSGALCREMKTNHFMVHICMDHSYAVAPNYDLMVDLSDRTLVIPRSALHRLRARFSDKICAIPQVADFLGLNRAVERNGHEPQSLTVIPRPRLGFFGNVLNLNRPVLQSVLQSHPLWQFVCAGAENAVPLHNSHILPWTNLEGLASYTCNIDVGFMPYDCYDEQRLHCLPLKMFEYFAFGLPVVSTPLIHLWQYKDLIYFGETAEELARAVEAALAEPKDSPRRAARVAIAREHSLESLALALRHSLPLEEQQSV